MTTKINPNISPINYPTSYTGEDITSVPSTVILVIIIAFFTILRLIFANILGFGVDETYYLALGRDFSLSYLDHPPLTFWIANIITSFDNIPSPLFARSFFILFSIFTQVLLFDLTSYLFSRRAGLYAVFFFNITPVLSIADGSWVLPDGPLIMLLLLCSCCLVRLFVPPSDENRITKQKPWLLWLVAGFSFGLATLTKYHAPVWIIGVFIFMLFEYQARYWLSKPYPWIALLFSFLVSLPLLIWNFQNNWASFTFQMSRAIPIEEVSDNKIFGAIFSIIAQSLWMSPWIFILLFISLFYCLLKPSAKKFFCIFLALPIILTFSITTFIAGVGLPHWQMPGYLFLFPLLGLFLASRKKPQIVTAWSLFALIVFVISISIGVTHSRYGSLSSILPVQIRKDDPTLDSIQWHELKEPIESYSNADPNTVIIASNWIDAAKIDFVTGGKMNIVLPFSDPRHFAYRYPLEDMKHSAALLVIQNEEMINLVDIVKLFYKKTTFLETIPIKRKDITIKNIELWYLER